MYHSINKCNTSLIFYSNTYHSLIHSSLPQDPHTATSSEEHHVVLICFMEFSFTGGWNSEMERDKAQEAVSNFTLYDGNQMKPFTLPHRGSAFLDYSLFSSSVINFLFFLCNVVVLWCPFPRILLLVFSLAHALDNNTINYHISTLFLQISVLWTTSIFCLFLYSHSYRHNISNEWLI